MDQNKKNNLSVDEIIDACCERNTPLEIHKHCSDGAVPVAKARMMCADAERIYLDEPQTIGKDVEMGKGTNVDVFFSLGDDLYTCSTSVASMKCKVRLNEHKTLVGMALDLPTKITKGQRRSRFRTSLAMQAPIPVTMHEAFDDLNSAPVNAKRFSGRLVDASEGGVGVLLDFDRQRKFKLYGRWIVEFHLPGESDPTILGCELRQTRTVRENELMKIGFLALPWPSPRAMREQLQPLTRFLTSIERNLLKRAS